MPSDEAGTRPERKEKMIDFREAANKIRATYKDKKKAAMISTGADMTTPTEDTDFVVLPEWFQTMSGTKGLPFGYVVMIAGNTDSGKTSFTIEAMNCAQEQGINIILVDTERKTTATRLRQWGVDPERMALVRPQYLEECYDGIDKWIDTIKDNDPDSKILVIFDSVGNTPSMKEVENDVDDTLQLGLAAKTNKRGLRRLIPRLKQDDIALLIINQTYENIASPGRTNAGGKAMDFFSCLTYQTSRKGWLEKTVKGEKKRIGARVRWTLYKNHLIDNEGDVQKVQDIDITAEGMKLVE